MRLIDADELTKDIEYSADMGGVLGKVVEYVKYYAKYMVASSPTIEERKKGKWIKKDCDLLYCSECDLPSLHPWPYCERCGAKMEV